MQQMGVEDDCQRSSMELDGRMQQEIVDAEGHRRMQIYYLKMQHDDDQASGLEKFFKHCQRGGHGRRRGRKKKKKKKEEEEEGKLMGVSAKREERR